MNTTESRFEDRLLCELRAVVAANAASVHSAPRPAVSRLRRPVTWGAAMAVVGITVAAFIVTRGSSAAYAVDSHSDGSVTVVIKSLEDASGLERQLHAAGVNAVVDYVPEGKACQQPRFEHPAAPSAQESLSVTTDKSGAATFTISKGQLGAEDTLVIESSLGQSSSSIGVSVAAGTVAPCTVIDSTLPVPAPGSDVGQSRSNGSGPKPGV
jgi:hypothetical protein